MPSSISPHRRYRIALERLPVLRETRMPAVLVRIGPVRLVLDSVPTLAERVVRALELWISRAT